MGRNNHRLVEVLNVLDQIVATFGAQEISGISHYVSQATQRLFFIGQALTMFTLKNSTGVDQVSNYKVTC